MVEHTQIIKKLIDNDFDAYIVGGAVRDKILDVDYSDVDLATSATPDEIINLFDGEKIDLVGTEFKVTIIDNIEVATYRKDIYDDRNHLLRVEVADTIQDDLSRRDLTINAMAIDPLSGDIIDPHGGRDDLKSGTIRMVGDPVQRIREDPLRMLRACRFLTTIDGHFDGPTFDAIKLHAHLIQYLPKERFKKEIMRAMSAPKASKFFNALRNTGLLEYIFPEMVKCVDFDGGQYHDETIYDHLMICGDNINVGSPVLKLAGYLHDVGKPYAYNLNCDGSFKLHDVYGEKIVRKMLTDLKFPNVFIDFIGDCVKFHMYHFDRCNPKSIKRFLNKINNRKSSILFDHEVWIDLYLADGLANLRKDNKFILAISKQMRMNIDIIINQKQPFSIKDLRINGNDIMDDFELSPGKHIGVILKKLLEKVIDNPDLNNYDDLKLIASEIIRIQKKMIHFGKSETHIY